MVIAPSPVTRIKAPDWLYVASTQSIEGGRDRHSYTPHLEGDVPQVVMEFLSQSEGDEYSAKQTFPLGKWFYYEQILQIPVYAIFNPATGDLEVHRLEDGRYSVVSPSSGNRYWIEEIGLFLGVWQGEKEGRHGYWLRWWDENDRLLLWAVEKLTQEHQLLEQERRRADRLAELLRSQGIDPDTIE